MNIKVKSAALAVALLVSNTCCAFPVDFAPGTPLVEAIRALGVKAGRNVIINGDLQGTVSMRMEDTDFEQALKALCLTNNFSYDFYGDVVLVAPQKALNSIETFKLKHLEPKLAAEQMGLLVDKDNVVINDDLHSITVVGSSSVLERVRNQIDELDTAQQQVNIKATVIELSKGKVREMGLAYSSNPWTKDTSVAGYNGFKFGVSASHEETISNGTVLARPNVTTFDGRKASILMGDKVPVFTSTSDSSGTDSDTSLTVEYKDIGVKLEVLPRINELDKETITMVIKPSVSTISQWIESGNNKAPQISERNVETTVRVKAGETILIGGLLKNEEIKSIKQIPFLSKLPVLGELFKSRSIDKKDTEIVIAITPSIVYDENGKPQVEMQKTSPTLGKKLNELNNEKELTLTEQLKSIAEEKAQLQKELNSNKASSDEEKQKLQKTIAILEQENSKVKGELKSFVASMKKVMGDTK